MAQLLPVPKGELVPEDFLRTNGVCIAKLMASGDLSHSMKATVVKQSPSSLILKLNYRGQTKLVKHFAADNSAAFKREVTTLRLLLHSGLVPKIEHACTKQRFLISEFVDGKKLSDSVAPERLEQICHKLGVWSALYSKAVPQTLVQSNWKAYFDKCPDLKDTPAANLFSGLLEHTSISRTVLSRGDCAFDNFLVTPDDELIGVDFECAQMKPLGWDLMQIARVFSGRFPDQIDEITRHLADGFCQKTPGSTHRYQALMKVFVAATVFGDLSEAGEQAEPMHFTSKSTRKNQFMKILSSLYGRGA